MVAILHVVCSETLGGGVRAMVAAAKYSAVQGDFRHHVAFLMPPQKAVTEFVRREGLEVIAGWDGDVLRRLIPVYDIVQVEWWNMPQLDAFLRSDLPAMRLLSWAHIGGHRPPQVIPPELIEFSDFALASSPHCYRADAFQQLSCEIHRDKTDMIYDSADFARLETLTPRRTHRFTVGYIGLLEFKKLHADFIAMSAGIKVPGIQFVLCGTGVEEVLREQVRALRVEERFVFRGYVDDIGSEIETFDVYGYPVCEDTYASGELNLQEVMYAGVPPVVFPYGGIRDLVIDQFTGMVVTTQREYREAIEFLYHYPRERQRLGRNAQAYARQIFGAHNAAGKFNHLYMKLMRAPKRIRRWPAGATLAGMANADRGAAALLAFLGPLKAVFERSMLGTDITALCDADRDIAHSTPQLLEGGILTYRDYYPNDRYLRLWAGLVYLQNGLYNHAYTELTKAVALGCPHWRTKWYLAKAAIRLGRQDVAADLMLDVLTQAPDFFDPSRSGVGTEISLGWPGRSKDFMPVHE
ncbi:MAG: glycosyltransferase [Candidatus Entotheonellia bacterium]